MLHTINGTRDRQMATIGCKTMNGMFPHEVGILIRGADQWYESMVDLDVMIDIDGQSARIPVEVVERETRRVLVQLPRQVVAGGRRIWVNESDIRES